MLKRSLVIAIGLVLATAAGAHAAAILRTVPFPGFSIGAGSAFCNVANIGTKPGTVTMELLAFDGVVVATDGPLTLDPGHAKEGSHVSLAEVAVASCRITVPSKTRYRGSFAFANGNVPPTVLPAQ